VAHPVGLVAAAAIAARTSLAAATSAGSVRLVSSPQRFAGWLHATLVGPQRRRQPLHDVVVDRTSQAARAVSSRVAGAASLTLSGLAELGGSPDRYAPASCSNPSNSDQALGLSDLQGGWPLSQQLPPAGDNLQSVLVGRGARPNGAPVESRRRSGSGVRQLVRVQASARW
jgi:hypothetical protein